MKNAATIKVDVTAVEVECPACGHSNADWVVDPRGQAGECDNCSATFRIATDADIRFG